MTNVISVSICFLNAKLSLAQFSSPHPAHKTVNTSQGEEEVEMSSRFLFPHSSPSQLLNTNTQPFQTPQLYSMTHPFPFFTAPEPMTLISYRSIVS